VASPLGRIDDSSLTTLSHLALILMYTCVLAIKTCHLSPAVCSSYGFGDSAKGLFLFFLFFALSMLLLQLVVEIALLAYIAKQQKLVRRLRYVNDRNFVEFPPVLQRTFSKMPGFKPSATFHLFLSHAWPLGQDVCKLIKQRCREICPSLHVFLDVEDLTSGYGAESVDSSHGILVFGMAVYFEKINCIRELVRAIVRNKQLILLLPDAEVHGAFTQAMIRNIVTDEWVEQWQLEKLLSDWAVEWGVAELKPPTALDICEALLKYPPLEWSRLTPFQDRTMVLLCQRLLPESGRNIYLQGAARFKLPRGHAAVDVYCSSHNLGSRELALELNGIWARLVQLNESVSACDHMLVYLNEQTWNHNPEALEVEIREAQRLGVHLQLAHEFPSLLDPGSARRALGFTQIMEATPDGLKQGARNIFKEIAIGLKGGELREVGLAVLAAKLVTRVPRAPVADQRQSSANVRSSRAFISNVRNSRGFILGSRRLNRAAATWSHRPRTRPGQLSGSDVRASRATATF